MNGGHLRLTKDGHACHCKKQKEEEATHRENRRGGAAISLNRRANAIYIQSDIIYTIAQLLFYLFILPHKAKQTNKHGTGIVLCPCWKSSGKHYKTCCCWKDGISMYCTSWRRGGTGRCVCSAGHREGYQRTLLLCFPQDSQWTAGSWRCIATNHSCRWRMRPTERRLSDVVWTSGTAERSHHPMQSFASRRNPAKSVGCKLAR